MADTQPAAAPVIDRPPSPRQETAPDAAVEPDNPPPADSSPSDAPQSAPVDAPTAEPDTRPGENHTKPEDVAAPPSPSDHSHPESKRSKRSGKGSSTAAAGGPTKQSTTTANSSNDSHPKKSSTKPPPRQKKPSLWSRLIHGLVPCVGPSKAHPINVDAETGGSAEHLHEKQRPVEADAEDEKTKPSAAQHAGEPSSSTLSPAPLTAISIPPYTETTAATPGTPTSTDPAVIVPPTPKSHILPKEETEGVTSGAVQPPGSTGTEELDQSHHHHDDASEGTDGSSFTDEADERGVMSGPSGPMIHDEDDDEDRLIMNGGVGIPVGPDGVPRPLLPPLSQKHQGRKCLVLDLDETLVHSSFKLIPQADYVVPVEIEWQWHNVYVIKRPGVDNFLKRMGELYEVVVFTASLSKYADPVLDKLDIHKVVSHRLFRDSCYNHRGNYVKDLSQLGRPMTETIILDNSPASYIFHPNNAVPVSSWFNDPHDTELTDLCPFLADLGGVDDVRGVLDGGL